MNSKTIGERTEAIFLAEFLKRGKTVLLPFGDNQRYDLVLEERGSFFRIQCKTGRIKNGTISFSTCSSYIHRDGGKRDYRGQVEYFGVYCPKHQKVYLVPAGDVGKREGVLRLQAPMNHQVKKIRWARDYEL